MCQILFPVKSTKGRGGGLLFKGCHNKWVESHLRARLISAREVNHQARTRGFQKMLILTQCRRTHTNSSLYQLWESKLNGKITKKMNLGEDVYTKDPSTFLNLQSLLVIESFAS